MGTNNNNELKLQLKSLESELKQVKKQKESQQQQIFNLEGILAESRLSENSERASLIPEPFTCGKLPWEQDSESGNKGKIKKKAITGRRKSMLPVMKTPMHKRFRPTTPGTNKRLSLSHSIQKTGNFSQIRSSKKLKITKKKNQMRRHSMLPPPTSVKTIMRGNAKGSIKKKKSKKKSNDQKALISEYRKNR